MDPKFTQRGRPANYERSIDRDHKQDGQILIPQNYVFLESLLHSHTSATGYDAALPGRSKLSSNTHIKKQQKKNILLKKLTKRLTKLNSVKINDNIQLKRRKDSHQ